MKESWSRLVTLNGQDHLRWLCPSEMVLFCCVVTAQSHDKSYGPIQYPLPKLNDIFASLARGQPFTVLDLSHAYN